MTSSSLSSLRGRLADLLQPVALGAGYDLEDVAVTPAGKRRVLRVVVDRDGGVALDDIAELSRAASAALDESGLMGSTPYVLEVSSPGIDRPLTAPRHWRRAHGRLVRLSTRDGADLTGRILSAADDDVTIELATGPVTLTYEAVRRAVVEVEFTGGGSDETESDRAGGPATEAVGDEEAPA